MTEPQRSDPSHTMADDSMLGPSRRTVLASERTWLAWFRTGVGVSAAAVAVGGVIPRLVEGSRWPFIVLGVGYALLALGVFVMGLARYREIELAIEEGNDVSSGAKPLLWLTVFGALLSIATIVAMIASA